MLRCMSPNKIPNKISQTIVGFGAITDIWNVSINILIMDKNTTEPHL